MTSEAQYVEESSFFHLSGSVSGKGRSLARLSNHDKGGCTQSRETKLQAPARFLSTLQAAWLVADGHGGKDPAAL